MKKLLILAFALLSLLSVKAQSYSTLWKQVETARNADKPKSAITALQSIERKATAEHQYGHLFAALFSELGQQQEISPDSFTTTLKRIEERHTTLKSQDNIASILYSICLKRYNKGNGVNIDSLIRNADAATLKTLTRKDAALTYMPLIEKGRSSANYFANDLLSVIASEMNDYKPLIDYYSSIGNRKAACLSASRYLGSIIITSKAAAERHLSTADSLITVFGDLKECGALAINKLHLMQYDNKVEDRLAWIEEALKRWPNWQESNRLRNARTGLILPSVNIKVKSETYPTTRDVIVYLNNIRNISEITVKAIGNNGKPVITTKKLGGSVKHANYEFFNDSINIGRLPLGTYRLELLCDGKPHKDESLSLHITNLKIISLPCGGQSTRFVIVNATTGQPVSGATLHIKREKNSEEQTFTSDSNGEIITDAPKGRFFAYATTSCDKYMNLASMSTGSSSYIKPASTSHRTNLFTDRAIYRPGQTVHVSALAYDLINKDETAVLPDRTIKLTLRDANFKDVESKEVTTDAYGIASTDFILPEACKNGVFRINVTGGNAVSFRVEDYVRPTFEVSLDQPSIAYRNGDTISVNGKAKTYSGVPVAGARVIYSVNRKGAWWWRNYDCDEGIMLTDTITTSEDGSFTVRMPMLLPDEESAMPFRHASFYNICAHAQVTDIAGESHDAELSLPLSNRTSVLTSNIPEKILADSSLTVTINRLNAAGKEIDGKVDIIIDGYHFTTIDANKPLTYDNLSRYNASGRHKLVAICENDTLRQHFTIFSLNDTSPAEQTHDWWYVSSSKLPATVQFGSSDHDVYAVYSLFREGKLIESGSLKMDYSVTTRSFEHKEEYGDGICYNIAWVKDGVLYSHNATLERPLPEKSLTLKWTTFRNRLLPGQNEEWRLTVTDAQGKPASANIMATLYDKSLDAKKSHKWSFNDPRYISIPSTRWRTPYSGSLWSNYAKDYRELAYHALDFSHLNDKYFSYGFDKVFFCLESATMQDVVRIRGKANSSTTLKGARVMAKSMAATAAPAAPDTDQASEDAIAGLDINEEESVTDALMRSDLSETAFFMPAIRTDENGMATLSFTLPESVTTWRLMAFANDKEMRTGSMTDEVIAQKNVMIQPRVPRFLREGDVTVIPATVSNISNKDYNTTVSLTILNSETEKVVSRQKSDFVIKSGETAPVEFSFKAKGFADKTLIVRYSVQYADGSDGEQHLLPILSNKERMVNTKTLILNKPANQKVDISDMLPASASDASLKVEYVDAPEWLMVKALPEVEKYCEDNAISLVSAYYANSLTAAIKGTTANSSNLISRLSALQNADGSWSWWKGMNGSTYMTTAVLRTLVRLHSITADVPTTIINRGLRYLDSKVADDIKRMKENESKYHIKPHLSSLHLYYLYCYALYGSSKNNSTATKNSDYLMPLVADATRFDDMATKADAAIVLFRNGKKETAKEFMQSIVEHTVYRADMGRYFDSHRAAYSWCDYRIPTQTSAIEALKLCGGDNTTITEMQRWLLQSKRTQSWDTPVNAVNAIHAFLGTNALPLRGDSTIQRTIRPITSRDKSVTIKKTSNGESWANIFVEYSQDTSEATSSSTGIAITRTMSNTNPKVGDKVTVTITVTADRDYDFVTVTDKRAACLEPVSQLSGYRQGCYREMRDSESRYHYNMLAKGTHTITTEYYVVRQGDYSSGIATAQCTYAPEFSARTTPLHLTSVAKP